MLEEIILRALAKQPAERQTSMAVLHSQLELVRGNATASSEALLRLQRDRVRPIPLGGTPAAGLPEIKTLGDTAVSRPVTGQTAAGRPARRRWLPLLGMAVAAVATVVWLYDQAHRGPAPQVTPAVVAPTPPPAPPPPPPSPPVTVEIALDSVPAGASVYLGDVLVGVTPTKRQAPERGEPLEFTFKLEGFEPERIRALPAPGLTVTAKFTLPAKRAAPQKRKSAKRTLTEASTDIQTER